MILQGDCVERLKELQSQSVQCCVTSPPYWGLRDYGVDGQLGLESTPEEYVANMVEVFRKVKRVLRDDGTLWLNLGDSYAANAKTGDKRFGNPEFNVNRPSRELTKTPARTISSGLKPKDLVGIPWMVAFALRADGWYLRSDIIWNKPNCMPESVTDRPTKAHEYIFLLSKSEKYYYDYEAIKEDAMQEHAGRYKYKFGTGDKGAEQRRISGTAIGEREFYPKRNRRTVWTVSLKSFKGAHFATYPPDLIEPCVLAGCPEGGIVLDPFFGAGTTGLVARRNKRNYVGIELNPEYAELAEKRILDECGIDQDGQSRTITDEEFEAMLA